MDFFNEKWIPIYLYRVNQNGFTFSSQDFLMDDMFGMQYNISVENQPYPVLCTLSADGCTAHVPDFPKIEVRTPTLDSALLEVKQQIQKALRQYKNPPIPTRQDQIAVPTNSVLVLVKAG